MNLHVATWKRSGVISAVLAAVLFGASTPLAKSLLESTAPILLAGLLYLGSGVGLALWWVLRRLRGHVVADTPLTRRDFPWLAGSVVMGGMIAPALLMVGLAHVSSASTSLLLNLEGVFTAVLAWVVFRENTDRRVVLGVAFIVGGGVLLSWPTQGEKGVSMWVLAVAGACLAWAIDNNLTRRIAASDAVSIACIKGLAAGLVNTSIALALGHSLPGIASVLAAGVLGAFGYGLSLVLFVLSLRQLGSARTGAYFSTAPFFGAALSVLLLHETTGPMFWGAALLMALGVWLHLTEHHEHVHEHSPAAHTHEHVHDEHHQHEHDFPWNRQGPHVHLHRHERLVHRHPHYPDVHHRHEH